MSRVQVAVEAPVTTDRRQNERRPVGRDAFVTVFGTEEQWLHGTLNNIAEGGTQLTLEQYVRPSSLVKVEYEDNFLLGEVAYCRAEGSSWLVGVRVEHGLFGLSALAAALQKSWG